MLVFAAVASLAAPAFAQEAQEEINCGRCHRDVTFESPAHPDLTCQNCHTNVVSRRHRAEDLAELRGDAICAQCHGLAGKSISRSVHEQNAGCTDCHGAPHEIKPNDDFASPMAPILQIQTCGGCHDKKEGLIEAYVDSVHGKGLLKAGLVGTAPSCSSCHGSHRIMAVESPKAQTSHEHAPETCGACHQGVLRDWRELSAHGIAWQANDDKAPVCTTCHESHAIQDPTRGETRLHFPEECGDCHGEKYDSYRHNFHGKFTQLGLETAATCSDCHTPHANLAASDPRSSVNPDNLAETCGQCHQDVSPAFMQIGMHIDPTNPDDNVYVYWVYIFMMALLVGVFAFFGIHDLLWLQRAVVGSLKSEYHRPGMGPEKGPYVRRFRGLYIGMHIVIILTFLLLALTGLPLKFDQSPWAQTLMDILGGVDTATALHRFAAIGTFGYMGFHVLHLFFRFLFKHERGLFWGPHSMTPQWQDVKDLVGNLRYFLYLGPRPHGDRFTYWEKFDYLAVFWGVMVIGLSGLMLWIPELFTRFLPGWVINAAYVVHSDEALLATGFIFVFHFFHTHLRPESFPMDPVVFTGRMPLEKFKEERPREYQRMVEKGTLDAALCEPPTREELTWVYLFGFSAVAIGLALAVAIFWALLSY